MVNALDSGPSGPDSSPGRGTVLCFGQDTTLTVPLFTQVYKWLLVNLILEVALRTSIPSRGKKESVNE